MNEIPCSALPMAVPPESTPLYNHPLPILEDWLEEKGCIQDSEQIENWHCQTEWWEAELRLEETHIWVRYSYKDGNTKTLTFPYSLSREDVEQAIFAE